jgi:hypothetical protein
MFKIVIKVVIKLVNWWLNALLRTHPSVQYVSVTNIYSLFKPNLSSPVSSFACWCRDGMTLASATGKLNGVKPVPVLFAYLSYGVSYR